MLRLVKMQRGHQSFLQYGGSTASAAEAAQTNRAVQRLQGCRVAQSLLLTLAIFIAYALSRGSEQTGGSQGGGAWEPPTSALLTACAVVSNVVMLGCGVGLSLVGFRYFKVALVVHGLIVSPVLVMLWLDVGWSMEDFHARADLPAQFPDIGVGIGAALNSGGAASVPVVLAVVLAMCSVFVNLTLSLWYIGWAFGVLLSISCLLIYSNTEFGSGGAASSAKLQAHQGYLAARLLVPPLVGCVTAALAARPAYQKWVLIVATSFDGAILTSVAAFGGTVLDGDHGSMLGVAMLTVGASLFGGAIQFQFTARSAYAYDPVATGNWFCCRPLAMSAPPLTVVQATVVAADMTIHEPLLAQPHSPHALDEVCEGQVIAVQ